MLQVQYRTVSFKLRSESKKITGVEGLKSKVFFLFDSLHPSQQFFSYVAMGLPGLDQY